MTNKNKSFYERFMIKKAEFQKQKEEDALLNQVMTEVLSSIDEDDRLHILTGNTYQYLKNHNIVY